MKNMFETSEAIEGSELQEWEYYVDHVLDTDKDVKYLAGVDEEPIEEWLENNKPSTICRDEGFEWIYVIRSSSADINTDDDNEEDGEEDSGNGEEDSGDEEDFDGLEDAWEALNISERHICAERVFELARDFRVTCGKWMFWVSPGGKGDHFWSLVAKGVASGKTLAVKAQISALEKTGPNTNHVVCIYNDNFLDEDQVYESERTIRSLGIKCPLHYKPDIYTFLDVYRKNPWNINPIIYTSHFDVLKNESIIRKKW